MTERSYSREGVDMEIYLNMSGNISNIKPDPPPYSDRYLELKRLVVQMRQDLQKAGMSPVQGGGGTTLWDETEMLRWELEKVSELGRREDAVRDAARAANQ